jgi:hypothetical protein
MSEHDHSRLHYLAQQIAHWHNSARRRAWFPHSFGLSYTTFVIDKTQAPWGNWKDGKAMRRIVRARDGSLFFPRVERSMGLDSKFPSSRGRQRRPRSPAPQLELLEVRPQPSGLQRGRILGGIRWHAWLCALALVAYSSGPAISQGQYVPALTEVQATVPLLSHQTTLTPGTTRTHDQPVISNLATQNWATYVTNTTTSATGRAVVVDSNGNAYVTGSTDETGTKQAFVAGYDPQGNQLFLTKFQATDVSTAIHFNHSEGHALALDGSGNIYVTGQATNPNTRLQDGFIMRLNSSGKVDSTYGVAFDTGGLGNVSSNGIVVTPDGTATIAGSARFLGNDIFVAQVAANGSVNYGNAFPPADFQDNSGNGPYNAVAGNGLAFSGDGSQAYISGTATLSSGGSDVIVMAIDTATGSQPTGTSAVRADGAGGSGGGIAVGADGTIFQVGTVTIQTNGQSNTYAAVFNWRSDLTTTNSEFYDKDTPSVTGTGIALDAMGNVYLTGTGTDVLGNTRALAERLEPNGQFDSLLIADNGSGQEAGYGIAYSPDGTVYVTGSTTSSNLSTDGSALNGNQDAFLASVGSFGN